MDNIVISEKQLNLLFTSNINLACNIWKNILQIKHVEHKYIYIRAYIYI
jgi:hypothetical protein